MTASTLYGTLNMTFQWGGDRALLHMFLDEGVDVGDLVECRTRDDKPLDIKALLGKRAKDYYVKQNLSSSTKSGSALIVRKKADVDIRWSRISLLSPAGKGVQARYLRTSLVVDRGIVTRLGTGHIALQSSGRQDDGERRMQRWVGVAKTDRRLARNGGMGVPRWRFAGDGNQGPEEFRGDIGAHHGFGKDPMLAAWSKGFDFKSWAKDMDHADHKILFQRDRV